MNTMKLTTIAVGATLLCAAASAQETNKFKNDLEKNSYALGMSWGSQVKQGDVELDYELLLRGFKDTKSGSTVLTEAEMRETLTKLSNDVRAKLMEKQRQIGEKNKTDGDAFLEANKTKPGVITLPNGLQYKVLAEGSGESPKPEDIVTANYRGTLIDGTEFDASKPDQPLTRAANQVIKGWTEALIRMKPGAKWQLFIPSDLGYSERGSGKIGPNSALIFDVELLSFKPAPPPTPPPVAQPLTSDIIKVPSLEEMKKGAKIETIKAEDVERLQKEAQQKQEKPK